MEKQRETKREREGKGTDSGDVFRFVCHLISVSSLETPNPVAKEVRSPTPEFIPVN